MGAGGAIGMFVTALVLWRHERRTRRLLSSVTDRLRASDERFQALVRDSSDIVCVIDAAGAVQYISPAADRILGHALTTLAGANVFEYVHPDDRQRVVDTFLANKGGMPVEPIEFRVLAADGTYRLMEAVGNNLLDNPKIGGLVINARDITERKRSEIELRDAQERFRSAFEHAAIGMALMSIDGRLFRVNRALVRMLGRAEDQLLGASLFALTHVGDREAVTDAVDRLLAGEVHSHRVEQRMLHVDDRMVWVSLSMSLVRDLSGKPLYVVSQIEDITERKASGARLAHLAIHDPLTGLPNRLLFVDRMRRALSSADADHRVAVVFIDLDHFKVVNDSLGHPAGDRLLVAIADRLRATIRPSDTVARFGGDEFTVLCSDVPDELAAQALADRIASAVSRPITLAEGEVYVTASLGIALSESDLETPETLLRNADAAMYTAKEQGRARIEIFRRASHDRAVAHLRTGSELHRALQRNELEMHYQPIVNLETGRVTGFEALLRWRHPERGLVPPDDFIGLAEETGLVVPIGVFALESACQQLVQWHAHGAPVSCSVNLSPRQLVEPSLMGEFSDVLRRTGVDPDVVWLEITESTLMRDPQSAVTTLEALRALGVHLAVDDFGTGYSSMSYLKRFPVETLKVDRTFVDGLGRDPEDSAICTAIVSLAHALGLRAIAEGVETPEQLAELRTLGCEYAQGFLFGRPVPASNVDLRHATEAWAGVAGG